LRESRDRAAAGIPLDGNPREKQRQKQAFLRFWRSNLIFFASRSSWQGGMLAHAMRLMMLLLFAALASESAFAGATIEGIISATPNVKNAPVQKRYKATPNAGEPDPQRPVVYLEGDFSNVHAANTNVVSMNQLKFQFNPGILPVQRGTRVLFPNMDDDYHNVFSYSKPKRFDLGRYRKDEKPPSQVFDKPGVVRLFCEIHEHMRATILVLDTPFFDKTDANGHYTLKDVPPGKYTLKAWVDENQVYSKPVEVREGETLKVDFNEKT
jgi:plastocyanin